MPPTLIATHHRTCTRCGHTKGTPAFRTLSGGQPDSWCRACHNASNREYKRRYKNTVLADKEVRRATPDPLEYSRHHCQHIADYTQRAIERIQSLSGQEAPPQLSAILNLAQSLVDQHPPPRERKSGRPRVHKPRQPIWDNQACHNPDCGKPMEGRKRMYCDRTCGNRAEYLRRRPTPTAHSEMANPNALAPFGIPAADMTRLHT